MAMYATPTELAGWLQQDLDTYTAAQALTLASAEFAREADTAFSATTVTWTSEACGSTLLEPPYRPITAVSQVRVNGSIVTGWSLRNGRIYRSAGFGWYYSVQPDYVEVDLTYGYTSVPDDVKLAVLEIAAGRYANPTGVAAESVDDYRVQYNGTPISSGLPWRDVAASYRGLLVA